MKIYLDRDLEITHYNGYGHHFDTLGFHKHNYDELVVVECGETRVVTGSGVISFTGSYAIFAPIGCLHMRVNDTAKPYERYCIQFNPEFVSDLLPDNLYKQIFFAVPLTAEELNRLRALLVPLKAASDIVTTRPLELHRQKLMLALLINEMEQIVKSKRDIRAPGATEGSLISDICMYISRHYAEPLTLESLAKQFYVSRSKLVRVFGEALNTTVHDYITAIRVSHARELLGQGITVQETAVRCGFTYATHFISVFRETVGMTPAKYRKQAMAENEK